MLPTCCVHVYHHQRYRSVFSAGGSFAALVVIGICVGALLDAELGCGERFDGLVYDAWMRLRWNRSPHSACVLLVSVDPDAFADGRVSRMIQKLHGLGASQIGLLALRSDLSPDILQMARQRRDLVFATTSQEVQESPAERDGSAPTGLIDLLPASQGVYRYHYGSRTVLNERKWALEAKMARSALLRPEIVVQGEFGISFRGGINSLPHVPQQTLLSDELVPELVENRLVLIGAWPTAMSAGISTPTTTDGQRMSRLELHGHILETLLCQNGIARVGLGWRFSFLAVLSLLGCFLYHHLRICWTLPAALGMLLLICLTSYVAMHSLGWWLPITSSLGSQLVFCLFVLERRLRCINAAMERITLFNKPGNQTSSIRQDDPWSSITDLIYQLFFPNRLVLMELPRGGVYLKIVKMVNCGPEDIFERRRDARRYPYCQAAECGHPLRIRQRQFFTQDQKETEAEIIAPLLFGGELLGFLVFGISTAVLESNPNIESQLRRLTEEVAGVLGERRGMQQQRDLSLRLVHRLTATSEEQALAEMMRVEQSKQRRLNRLKAVFEASESPAAVYNVFGQLHTMNSRMVREVQRRGLVPAEITAVALVAALAGRDQNYGRQVLRSVGMDGRKEVVPVAAKGREACPCLLNIYPLQLDAEEQPGKERSLAACGFLFELVSSQAFRDVLVLKDRVADKCCGIVEQQLRSLQTLAKEMGHEAESPDAVRRLVGLLKDDLVDALTTLRQGQSFLGTSFTDDPHERLPVNTLTVLENALTPVELAAKDRGIIFQRNFPRVVQDTLANPLLLQNIFRTILEFLVDTAYDQTKIRISVEDNFVQLTLRFENEGQGASVDRLRQLFSEEAEDDSGQHQRLREVNQWLEQWDGRLTVSSQVGERIAIEMALCCHHWIVDGPKPDSPSNQKINEDEKNRG